MRKKIISLVLLSLTLQLYGVSRTNGGMRLNIGEQVKSPVTGTIYQIGNENLPQGFDSNTIIITFPNTYYYDGKKQFVEYQLIVSGVKVSDSYKNAENRQIKKEEVIGTAVSSPVVLNIRCKEFDPYLIDVSAVPPEFEQDWYYFGIEMFLPTSPKLLDYQPIAGKTDEIDFWDYPDSLENLYRQATERGDDERQIHFSSFPVFQVCLTTTLSNYPKTAEIAAGLSSPAAGLIVRRYFSNCPYMIQHNYNGIPLRLYFQNGFDQYLKEEYKLGNKIYLYTSVIFILNGEFYCYVRDFTLETPKDTVLQKMQRAREFMEQGE